MPFPLHKAPRGLLELFRLRTLGAQPPLFGEQVTPVCEVSELYAADLKAISGSAVTTGSIAGVGISDDLVLTAQVRAHGISARFVVGAAAATNVSLGVELEIGGEAVGTSVFLAACNAASVHRVWMPFPRPIVLLANVFAGQVIVRARVSGTAAGADHTIRPVVLMDVITGVGT